MLPPIRTVKSVNGTDCLQWQPYWVVHYGNSTRKYVIGWRVYSHPCRVDLADLGDQASPCLPSYQAYPSFQVLLVHQLDPTDDTRYKHATITQQTYGNLQTCLVDLGGLVDQANLCHLWVLSFPAFLSHPVHLQGPVRSITITIINVRLGSCFYPCFNFCILCMIYHSMLKKLIFRFYFLLSVWIRKTIPQHQVDPVDLLHRPLPVNPVKEQNSDVIIVLNCNSKCY